MALAGTWRSYRGAEAECAHRMKDVNWSPSVTDSVSTEGCEEELVGWGFQQFGSSSSQHKFSVVWFFELPTFSKLPTYFELPSTW